MATSHPSVLKSVSLHEPHSHGAYETCPLCEQPIPHDRFEEINERIEARERERDNAITARLQEKFALEKARLLEEAEANAADSVAKARAESAAEARAEAQSRIEAAEEIGSSLRSELEQARRDAETTIEQMKQDAVFREAEIRAEAVQATNAAAQERIASAEQARAEAEAKAHDAEERVRAQQTAYEAQLAERLKEQREALESDKVTAVNAEKSAAFEEKLKFSAKIEELQRQVDKKTAEELGEGAEIDLFEALKGEFQGDRIERVNKGQPGADIVHTVIHNGRECGKIVYDSKNHGAWRNDFVGKLASDQMAAKAEHAILASRTFPQGARHLHVRDGVIIASPARVIALIQIIRQHLIQSHTLRLSNEARTQKTAALYAFITSERCADLLSRIDTHSDDLLDLQVKEKKAHDAVWKRQGELIRSVQKVRAELCNEIDTIIGTAGDTDARSE
jgi:hypothetical protein